MVSASPTLVKINDSGKRGNSNNRPKTIEIDEFDVDEQPE